LAEGGRLAAENLHAGYGPVAVLHGVSLRADPGEVVAVVGPNGAGKSTAFKAIVGLIRPTQGRVTLCGEDITGLSTPEVLKRGAGYVPQGRIVFPRMTVLENLEMGAFLERDPARLRERFQQAFALFPILAERRRQLAGSLSGGEQQMLAIARALMLQPRALLVDEPSLGLSPKYVDLVFDKIRELSRLGLTLLLVEQNAALALETADRGYVLELGRNRYEGRGGDLLRDPEVRAVYLGGRGVAA
jgi:ABC-type branched-subunit amino acid transport system ATPase component